jgi:RNA polymerase sigma-70 factor (ECF subfamily)
MLVTAFVAGDAAAFDELVHRYRKRVFGICLRYFGNPGDAEDAAQDAFVALFRRASTFSGTAAFSTWMYRVTTNACNDVARKRARRPISGGDVERLAGTADLQDVLATRELGVELEAALATLPSEYREVIVLHDVVGLPYEDIASRMDMAVGTVKSRIHRGHARLAATLVHLREPSQDSAPPTERS